MAAMPADATMRHHCCPNYGGLGLRSQALLRAIGQVSAPNLWSIRRYLSAMLSNLEPQSELRLASRVGRY